MQPACFTLPHFPLHYLYSVCTDLRQYETSAKTRESFPSITLNFQVLRDRKKRPHNHHCWAEVRTQRLSSRTKGDEFTARFATKTLFPLQCTVLTCNALYFGDSPKFRNKCRQVNQARNQHKSAGLVRWSSRRRRYDPSKRRTLSGLHGVTTQMAVLFILSLHHSSHSAVRKRWYSVV
jgi:hypothetical protein